MAEPIKHQIIKQDGVPMFVLVPFDEYVDLIEDDDLTIPHDVVEKNILEDKNAIRAWREYLKLSQKQVSEKLGISQAAFSQLEKKGLNLKQKTLVNIANAFGIDASQLTSLS